MLQDRGCEEVVVHGDVVPKISLEQLIIPEEFGLLPDLQDPAVTVMTTQDISKVDNPDTSSPNDHSNDLAKDARDNIGEDISTVCPQESLEDVEDSGDTTLQYCSMTTIHANPVSVRRMFINMVKQWPTLFHTPPSVLRLLSSPSLSQPLAQDNQETQVI